MRSNHYISLLSFLIALSGSHAQAAKMNKQEMTEYNNDLHKVSSHLLVARQQLQAGTSFTNVVGSNQLLKSKGDQFKIELESTEF